MEYKDYYKIMGLKRDASQDDIKRAHRKLARKYHPDISKEPDAEAKFKEAGEAYEVLKDPEKRAAYDNLGPNFKAGQEFHPPPDWDSGFEFSGGGFTEADMGGFSDFLTTAIDLDDGSASLDLAMSVVGYFELDENKAHAIAAEVGMAVRTWREEAARLGLTQAEIDRMASAFEHEDLKAALSLSNMD